MAAPPQIQSLIARHHEDTEVGTLRMPSLAKRYQGLQKRRASDLCRPALAMKAIRYRHLTRLACAAPTERVFTVNIFNSRGIHVGVVRGASIFDLNGQRLYRLKGNNIYRLSGELIGHLPGGRGTEKRLDRSADRLFNRTSIANAHD